jgi:hypothetical protein
MIIYRKWGSTDVLWKNANWTWGENQIVAEIVTFIGTGIDASKLYEEEYGPSWMKEESKKKRLIHLICKVKGESYDETKEVKNVKITIDDIRLVVKTVSGIELEIK